MGTSPGRRPRPASGGPTRVLRVGAGRAVPSFFPFAVVGSRNSESKPSGLRCAILTLRYYATGAAIGKIKKIPVRQLETVAYSGVRTGARPRTVYSTPPLAEVAPRHPAPSPARFVAPLLTREYLGSRTDGVISPLRASTRGGSYHPSPLCVAGSFRRAGERPVHSGFPDCA